MALHMIVYHIIKKHESNNFSITLQLNESPCEVGQEHTQLDFNTSAIKLDGAHVTDS